MRDNVIMHMQESNARRSMMLLKQFEFLNTRQLAYESVLSTRWAMFKAILDPLWLKREVDAQQLLLLSECKKQMEGAKAKPVITPVRVNGNGSIPKEPR